MPGQHQSVLPLSLEHATVADAMRAGIVACPPNAPATKVARMMALHHIHCVFVTHYSFAESEGPYVWGIVSDLDLMQAALTGDHAATADSLARQPIVTVKPSMPLSEAGALMVQHGVSHLVVVDPSNQLPIGVVSTSDVAEALAWGEE